MRLSAVGIVVLAGGLSVMPALARGKSSEGKAVPSASQAVLASWNEIGRKLTTMAEDFPEDKYDFKPTPEVRSFAQQLLHVAASMDYFTGPAKGQGAPASDDPSRAQYKTKADVVAYVKKCVEDGAAVIKAKGDKGMADTVVEPESKQLTTISDLAYGIVEHSGEHYGQLVVYYRISGLVPPESRPKK